MIQLQDTPVEEYIIEGKMVLVKREDLACLPPGPPFSKIRGLWTHMRELKQSGITTVGYVETAISMAGIGVARVGQELSMKVIIYDPQYSINHPARMTHEAHRKKWREFGAEIILLKPFMTKVNFNIAKKLLGSESDKIMLPLGLPLKETLEEMSQQVIKTDLANIKTIVVCVGSGTICAGIVKGISKLKIRPRIIGVMCRTGNRDKKKKNIIQKSGVECGGLFGIQLEIINPGWEYIDREEISTTFPCNCFYDQKALRYLLDNYNRIERPILFWNIGSEIQ